MKKILSALSLVALTACSANYENYYLNDFSIAEDVQSKATTEIALKNVVYARLLTNSEAVGQFGPKITDYSVVFFSAENIGEDASFFSFNNALLDNAETGRIKPLARIKTKYKNIDLNDEDYYMNPFRKTEMEDNNFNYNLNQKILNDFSLQPNQSQTGFLVFEKIREPSSVQFTLSSGVSIYTTRVQSIKLDIED